MTKFEDLTWQIDRNINVLRSMEPGEHGFQNLSIQTSELITKRGEMTIEEAGMEVNPEGLIPGRRFLCRNGSLLEHIEDPSGDGYGWTFRVITSMDQRQIEDGSTMSLYTPDMDGGPELGKGGAFGAGFDIISEVTK